MIKKLKNKKISWYFNLILSSPYGILCAIIIRILSPLIIIRIGCLNTRVIGFLSLDTYISYKHSLKNKKVVNIVCIKKNEFISNKFLIKIWKRSSKFIFVSEMFVIPIIRWNNILPFKHIFSAFDNNPYRGRDIYRLSSEKNTIDFAFNNKEKIFCENKLKAMGITNKSKYVCLHVRDSAYKNKTNKAVDWSYHDNRDADIDNYKLAIKHLIKKKFIVVRIGKFVNKKCSLSSKYFIDYSGSKYQSDLMDIYLIANCEFMISSGSGIDGVAQIFYKPILFVNMHSVGLFQSYINNSIGIFKKYKCLKYNKILSLVEILKRKLSYIEYTDDFRSKMIEKIENTPEEIRDATDEMISFYSNGLISKKTQKFTKFFWKKFIEYNLIYHPVRKVKTHHSLNMYLRPFI